MRGKKRDEKYQERNVFFAEKPRVKFTEGKHLVWKDLWGKNLENKISEKDTGRRTLALTEYM